MHTAIGIGHTGLLRACEQDQDEVRTFRPDPILKMSANLYDIHHCCVYSEKLLMMERGTVRNMKSFIPKNKFEKLVHLFGFIIRKKYHHHHVLEGLGMLACSLILKMKLVPPSLPRSSYVSSSVWFVF